MIQKDSRLFMHTATISMRQKSNTQKRGEKYFSAMVCLIIHCYEAHCTYKDHECALACIADKAASCSPLTACHVFSAKANTCSCLQVMGIARYLSIHHASLLLTIMNISCSIKIKQTPGNYE